MRVFVTGATGFIGTAIVEELHRAGHRVVGLARSDTAAANLRAAGAEVHRGALDDPDSLKRGAVTSDGVIHAAFNHDFVSSGSAGDFLARYIAAAESDRRAIETLGIALAGSGRPLVVTSGTALLAYNRLGTENDEPDPASSAAPRIGAETATLSMAARGVRTSVLRLPPSVHGDGDRGFVPGLIEIARERKVSGYVNEGLNRWPTVHRVDAARLYRLALEGGPAGARLHAVAEEGVPVRDIASAIGKELKVPVVSVSSAQAGVHFGWLANFIAMDNPASSDITRKLTGWHPEQPKLIEDIEHGSYFKNSKP